MTLSTHGLAAAVLGHAQRSPDATAFDFLGDDGGVTRLDYATLAARAGRLARRLQESSLVAGEPALILHAPGIDYVVAVTACLLAGVPAVPAYPPEPHRLEVGLARLRAIVDDARPASVLTTPAIGAALGEFGKGRLVHEPSDGDGLLDAPVPEDDPVSLIQYTSGSTRQPRGVLVRRSNLEHNVAAIARRFELSSASRAVIWLPPYHDMGLIGGIFTPMWLGFPVRLLSPLTFLKDPLLWLEQIGTIEATVSGGPNFAYELCVRRAEREPERAAALSLGSWSVAFNGAEPIRPRTLQEFAGRFAVAGFERAAFLPCYGLAEATLLVASTHWDGTVEPDGRVSCGPVLEDERLEIMAGEPPSPAPDGQEGEIWLSGPSVASGYHDESDALTEWDGARWLRTGDLGYRRDDELVVTGRSKDVIIHQGRNFHATDVEEAAIRADRSLRPVAAAFSTDDGPGGGEVVIAIETRGTPEDPRAVAGAVRAKVLAECGLRLDRVELLDAGSIPKTSSGKVQRHACRDQLAARRRAAPEVAVEAGLVEIVTGVLTACAGDGTDAADAGTTFIDMGGDSLRAAEAAGVLQDAFSVSVPVEAVLGGDARSVSATLAEAAATAGRTRELTARVEALRTETTSNERTTA